MSSSTSSSSGIGFGGLLTVLFIGLKLTDYIDWSWWWVVSPLWISLGIMIVIIIIIRLIIILLMATLNKILD